MTREDIERRQRELEAEIVRIQRGLEVTVSDVKDSVTANVKQWSRPETWVRRYPITTVLLAAGTGLILGRAVTGRARKTIRQAALIVPGAAPAPAPVKKRGAALAFLKPFVAQAWEQFGPAVLAYGQQVAARHMQAAAEAAVDAAQKPSSGSKSL